MSKIAIVFLILFIKQSYASNACHGHFIDPIHDICWECLFPLTIGSSDVVKSKHFDIQNPKGVLCHCSKPIERIGISFGFWEPASLVDVSRHPYCFVNLGGLHMKLGNQTRIGTVSQLQVGNHHSFYHVHWYHYPLLFWLRLLTDALCVDSGDFDVAYITELDPTWNDPQLAMIIHPELLLLKEVKTQAACAADCVAANTKLPSDKLFWCAGCQGSIYPLTGFVQSHVSAVQASLLLLQRLTYKLHRQGLLWGAAGSKALCYKYPMPVMKSSQYRYQMVNPLSANCYPYGYSSHVWAAGKQYPVKGEDFGYVVWRKRNCCAL